MNEMNKTRTDKGNGVETFTVYLIGFRQLSSISENKEERKERKKKGEKQRKGAQFEENERKSDEEKRVK